MKKFGFLPVLVVLLMMCFSSCELIGDIFQAGMAFGIILVVLIAGGIIALIARVRK